MMSSHLLVHTLLVLSVRVMSYEHDTLEELHISLNGNGSLIDPLDMPSCETGEKMDLISYQFQLRSCSSRNRCKKHLTVSFLRDDVLRLYEMCSLKERCSNLSFTMTENEQKARCNSVFLTYRCLDRDTTFIDICGSKAMYVNGTIQLTSSMRANKSTQCQCYVNSGEYSVKLNDIRLKAKNANRCSPATVTISGKQLTQLKCNENISDFGAVFNGSGLEVRLIPNASIVLTPNSKDDLPDMMWITLEPIGYATLTCEEELRPDIATSRQSVRTSTSITASKEGSGHLNTNTDATFSTYAIVAICIAIAAVIVILAVLLKAIKKSSSKLERNQGASSIDRQQQNDLLPKQVTRVKDEEDNKRSTDVLDGSKERINVHAKQEIPCNTYMHMSDVHKNTDNTYDMGNFLNQTPKRNPDYDHLANVKAPEK